MSSARAEASRKNGAKSRRPTTSKRQVASAQNALKHGMRAQKYVLPPATAVPGNANPKRAPSSRFFTLAADLSALFLQAGLSTRA